MASFFEQHKSVIITLIVLVVIVLIRINSSTGQNEPESDMLKAHQIENAPSQIRSVFVEIWGGIKNPGVYEVTDNILVIDLINLAGGFTDNADQIFAEKNITFSKKVASEMKVYIPFIDPNNEGYNKGLINLNYATREVILSIKGIGEVTADKIISKRPFLDWEDLKERIEIRNDLIQILKDSATI